MKKTTTTIIIMIRTALTDPATSPINAEDVSVSSKTSAMIRFNRL
jgi:hypothetical protein